MDAMIAVFDPSTNTVVLVPSSSMAGGAPAWPSEMPVPFSQMQGTRQRYGPPVQMQTSLRNRTASGPDGIEGHNHHLLEAAPYNGQGFLLPSTTFSTIGHQAGGSSLRLPAYGRRAPGTTIPEEDEEEEEEEEDLGGAFKRPRGGAEDSKEKNRQAQRRFRARQKVLIQGLKEQIEMMTTKAVRNDHEIRSLREENTTLKRQLSLSGSLPHSKDTGMASHDSSLDHMPQLLSTNSIGNTSLGPMQVFQQQQGQYPFAHFMHPTAGAVYLSPAPGAMVAGNGWAAPASLDSPT